MTEQDRLMHAVRTALKWMQEAERNGIRAPERDVLIWQAKQELINAMEQTDEYVRMLEREGQYDSA